MMITLIVTLSLVFIIFLVLVISAIKISGEISKEENEKNRNFRSRG